MAKPWERLEEESDLAFLAFSEWMHGAGSVQDPCSLSGHLKHQHGVIVSPESVVTWRGRYAWKKRRAAWQNYVQAERLKMISRAIGKRSAKLAVQHFRGREIAIAKTIRSLKRLEDWNAEDQDTVQSVIRKAIENLGNCVLDHDAQLRRLSAATGPDSDSELTETEEVIPPIPAESGCLQLDGPEAESVLGSPEGDMPGDR